MATGILRILGLVTGLTEGEEPIGPYENQTTTAVGQRLSPLTLSPGNNTILLPSSATMFILVPPPNNTATLTLKGVTGDTGLRLHKTMINVVTLDPGVAAGLVVALGGIATVNVAVIVV